MSDTILSIEENGCSSIFLGSGNLPEIQNTLTSQALATNPTHVWFVEDDMVIPHGGLDAMLKADKDIVAMEYPIDNGQSTCVYHQGELMWCGLGCTLVRTQVLKEIGAPYFTIDHSWLIRREPFRLEKIPNKNSYGGHDVNFCMRAKELGYQLNKLEGWQASHMRTDSIKRVQTNSGAYEFRALQITKSSEVE